MFGMRYLSREESVRRGAPAPGHFARQLLADLLNRSVALEVAYRRVYETHGSIDHGEALELCSRVVGSFLDDLQEAEIRGCRARLFSRGGAGGRLDADALDPEDDLEDLGGELVGVRQAVGKET